MRLTSKTTLVLTLGVSMVSGCKGESPSNTPDPNETPTTMGVQLDSVAPVAQGAMFWAPLDATPSPEGERVYFTASTEEGPAVLATDGAGGTPQVLYAGDLLSAPFGVVSSLDGETLFISDSARQDVGDEELEDLPVGGILSLATSGGEPALISGTEGTSPRSLHLSEMDGQEVLHFTGVDPTSGEAAVYRVSVSGGALETVASGAPLSQPSGIVVGNDGTVYVADSSAVEGGSAALLAIKDGQISMLAEELRLGYPAGLTLDVAGVTLLASGLADDADSSVVHAIDLSSGERSTISDGISQNSESGGVHRAHSANVFAWANSDGDERNPGGTVYLLKGAE